MVKTGHLETIRAKKPARREIVRIGYKPRVGYGLDLEIFSISDLRQRASAGHLGSSHRIEFHLLIVVTEGHCAHTVDFESIACGPGSLLALRPGQVQRFDTGVPWEGWLLLFRPEFLQSPKAGAVVAELEIFRQLEEMPAHLDLNVSERSAVADSMARMCMDAKLPAAPGMLHALLRSQLHALLIRLCLIQTRREQAGSAAPILLQRFKRYRQIVEQGFHQMHRVAEYARRLGCSEKSLSRATAEVAGMSAKSFLSQRIALEAKRLLAHTALPISAIADKLGFDEPTNFVKFFRREAGCSPGEFRKRHASN